MTDRIALLSFGCRPAFVALAIASALAAAGCAGPKDAYPAVAEAQQRQAAEEGLSARAGSNIDTQATYLKLVEQMQQEGLWFASLAHIDALEQRWGTSAESTRARAEALRHAGQAAQSETAYRRLLATPLAAAGYRGLGLLAGARGDFAEAVRMLKQARDRNPTDALLLNDLGYASLRAGLIDQARLPLMQALQLKPDNPQAQANLALYLEATQQREQATALMDANKTPPATRAAIREAARQLVAASAPTAAVTAPPTAGGPLLDDSAVPLTLRASQSTLRPRAGSTSKGTPP
jgi:Flp pilus assembly protein TadD